MIDYQSEFKQKLMILILSIIVLPLVTIIYFGYESKTIKTNKHIYIDESTIVNLRGTIREIKISKDEKIAYVIAASRGVYIVDIQNPLKPRLISQFKYFKNSYDKSRSLELLEEKKILFVKDAQAGIYSIDIENLSEPKLLASYNIQEQMYDFCISKNMNYIYLSTENSIKVLDIENLDEIKTVAKFNTDKKYYDIVEVNDELLYLLSSKGIDILDTSSIKNMKIVGSYITLGEAKKITLSFDKTHAFLSSGYSGVEIVDIANKFNPKPLGIHKSSGIVENTIASKDPRSIYLFNKNLLEIVDITDPDRSKLIQKVSINNTKKAKVWDIELSQKSNVVYVANGIGGIKIIVLK